MGSWLSEREQRLVAGAETASAATPIPTQIVSNGEYLPPPQSETQKRVERRIFELADDNRKRLGLSRRQFLQTGCGMAAAFLAMNEVYGSGVFQVAAAEAHEPELTLARAHWSDVPATCCSSELILLAMRSLSSGSGQRRSLELSRRTNSRISPSTSRTLSNSGVSRLKIRMIVFPLIDGRFCPRRMLGAAALHRW